MHRSFLFRFFILGLVLISGSLLAYKPTLRSMDILSVRQMGMGQAYTAIANDETLLQANPAGIGVRKMFQLNKEDPLFYFFPLKFGFSHSIYQGLNSGSFEEVFSPVGNRVNGSIDFNIGDYVYAGDFWAFSFFNRNIFNVFNTSGEVDFYYQFQILIQLNLGFRVYSFSFLSEKDFHIGVSGKIFYSIQSDRGLGYQAMYNKYTELQSKILNLQRLVDIFGEILNLYEGFGLGIDVGVLWEIPIQDTEHQINLGFMLEDAPTYAIPVSLLTGALWKYAYTEICRGFFSEFNDGGDADDLCLNPESVGSESTFLIPNAKIGVAYMLPDYLGSYFQDTLFALDFHRIGDPDYSFADSYHLGFSTSIFDFTDEKTGWGYRMNIGLGINQGQFNASILFHLKVYEIAYNYFQRKIVNTNHIEDRHVITFAFYF